MPNPERRPADGDPVIDATVKAAVLNLLGDGAPGTTGTPDDVPNLHWLGIGLRLGLERRDRARRLLELLEANSAAPAGNTANAADAADADDVPARSLLLTRSALTPQVANAEMDAEVMFGWVSRLTPGEILSMGRAVEQMVADGAPGDMTRGFGIAWRAGAKIPLKSLEGMMAEFALLQLVVAGVLADRDLATAVRGQPKSRGGSFGGLLQGRLRGASPAQHDADMTFQQHGKPASLGLVTLWNAWTAVRYRELIPAATFDLLVQPWVSVVGRLP